MAPLVLFLLLFVLRRPWRYAIIIKSFLLVMLYPVLYSRACGDLTQKEDHTDALWKYQWLCDMHPTYEKKDVQPSVGIGFHKR